MVSLSYHQSNIQVSFLSLAYGFEQCSLYDLHINKFLTIFLLLLQQVKCIGSNDFSVTSFIILVRKENNITSSIHHIVASQKKTVGHT
ncbi:MAG: hypothetical protein ACI8RD_012900 [Bacillariaceae sp.]|jgi:hypothetical protein